MIMLAAIMSLITLFKSKYCLHEVKLNHNIVRVHVNVLNNVFIIQFSNTKITNFAFVNL